MAPATGVLRNTIGSSCLDQPNTPLDMSSSLICHNVLVAFNYFTQKQHSQPWNQFMHQIQTMATSHVMSNNRQQQHYTSMIPRYASYWVRRATVQYVMRSTTWSRKILRITMGIWKSAKSFAAQINPRMILAYWLVVPNPHRNRCSRHTKVEMTVNIDPHNLRRAEWIGNWARDCSIFTHNTPTTKHWLWCNSVAAVLHMLSQQK